MLLNSCGHWTINLIERGVSELFTKSVLRMDETDATGQNEEIQGPSSSSLTYLRTAGLASQTKKGSLHARTIRRIRSLGKVVQETRWESEFRYRAEISAENTGKQSESENGLEKG